MKRVELSNVVLDVIAQQQPISIRDLVSEISSRIGCKVSKHEVKELLEIDLRDQVAKSRDKLWTLRTSATLSLSTLAAYYLESLALERDTEIKLYATPFDEDRPNFLVLKGLPIGQNRESVWPKKTRDFIADARPRAKNVNLYIGYPVFVKKGRKDSSDLVFPLFLFSLRMDQSDESGYPSLDIDPPRINSEAFKHSGNSFGDIQEDLKGIRSALGLDADDEEDLPTFPELIERLKEKYPAWPWREEIDIANLSRESLAEKSEGGFFNSAILFWGEGSKFVQGLESELTELRALKPEDYEESVLDQILDPPSGNIQADNEVAIYRHLPLNPAQAGAVNSAMVNPLTVITGPPGTGKSQVVGSIITNAALQGQSVLVSSRNHKAVDVVVDRVNGLAAQTFLHKLGSEGSGGDFSPLVSGITSRNSRREASNLDAIKRRSDELRRDLEAKREALDKGIQSRNHVDELSKDLQDDQPSRDSQLLNLGSKSLERKAAHCRSAFESLRNDQEKVAEAKSIIDLGAKSFFSRLLWGINKTSRLKRASDQLREIAGWHGIKALNEGTDAESLLRQCDFLMSKLAEKIEAARRWSDYYRELQNLEQFDLSACQSEYLSIEDKLATIDLEYWRAWLAELPRRLSPSDITIISDFAALTQLANAGDESEKRKIATRIKELTPRVTRILPAWAITSLSLRNRVPFEEGLFDLVVIDEASQCDIASALPLLFRAKRAVIIGDPQQLKHITSLLKATDTRLMTQFGILDHPTWGYSTNSLYDVMAASSIANRFTLIEHHRSADAIINFSNRQFYGGDLVIATRQRNLKRRTDTPTIDWVDVAGQVTSPGGSGALNQAEVEAVVTYLKDLLVERAYDGTVGVVTPFRKHANRIRDAVERDSDLRNVMSRSNLLVDTVHRFQGDERDIIIFSPVISLNISLSGLNFLKSQGNLFNVAITRARAHLVVIGDIDFCRKSGVKYLSSFVSYYEELERARPLALLDPATLTDAHPFATDPRVSHWEVVFYKALREAGLQPIPQYGVDKYALDFAVFRKDGAKLDIEVDGELYHKTWTGQTVRADTIRNQSLIELGWQVKRFWVYRLNEDLSSCVREIVKWASAGK